MTVDNPYCYTHFMDSLSQIALGSAIGYAVAGKQLGKKAFILGAIAGVIPDLDFIVSIFASDDFNYLNWHRGFSHSLIGAVTLPLIWAKLTTLYDRTLSFSRLWWLFMWGALTHLLLDCFTTWGTQVFWPLWMRVSFHSIFIIDPLYTLLLGLPLLLSFWMHKKRPQLVWIGLGLSTLYLAWGIGVKQYMTPKFEALFHHHNLQITRFITRPTAFNSLLWTTTAESKEGYYIAFISLFDKKMQDDIYYIPKNHHLNTQFFDKRAQKLLFFTDGFYTLEHPKNDSTSLWVHDLRFGTFGDPLKFDPKYVFTYHLTKTPQDTTQIKIITDRPQNAKQRITDVFTRLKGLN